MRTLSKKDCPCNAGYFDNGVALCAACDYTCLTCASTATNCTSCNITIFRTLNAAAGSCPCISGYYEDLTLTCVPCIVGCLTCATATDCITCDASKGFIPSAGICVCQNGMTQVSGVCPNALVCTTGCLYCDSTGCTSCDTANDYVLSGSSCVLCSSAISGCLTCSNLTSCSTCDTAGNYVLSGSTCVCQVGYALNGGVCQLCNVTLANCVQCSSTTVCTSCVSTFQLSSSICDCGVGFYLSGTGCLQCSLSIVGCLICSSAGVCGTCDTANNFVLNGSTCVCVNGTYLDGSTCVSCPLTISNCLSCTSSTTCTSCAVGYLIDSSNLCSPCSLSMPGCLICPSPGVCTSCDTSSYFTSSGFGVCNCFTGYYLSGSTCALCSTSITNCVSCSSPTNCSLCSTGYGLTLGNTSCIPCSLGCLSCQSMSLCYTCDLANNFVLAGTVCQCSTSSYPTSVGSCALCHYSCSSCTGPLPTDCTACDISTGRIFTSGSCLCPTNISDTGVAICGCQIGYTQDSSGNCQEICGDGVLYSLACDDGNTNDGDGCSSVCTVETDYVCNTSPGSPSICSYSKPIIFTLVKTIKNITSNSASFSFVVSPALTALKSLNFSQVIQCSLNNSAKLDFSYDGNGGLVVDAQYNQSIQGENVSLQFIPSVQSALFFATPNSNTSFVVNPTNNVAADYFGASVYDGVQAFQILSMVVMGLALAGFVAGLFTAKFIGVEMIGVVQVAFIGLAIVNYLPPLLAPLAKIGYINGVNIPISSDPSDPSASTSLPFRISSLEYGASMVSSLNCTVALLLLPFLVSLALYIAAKFTKNDEKKQQKLLNWSQTSLCEWGLTSVMFVLYHNITSLLIFAFYGSSVSSILLYASIGDALITVGTTVAIAVLFKYKEQFFGDYKRAFKSDVLSQSHYWFLMGGRVLLAALLIGANAIDYVGFIAFVVPLALIVYLGVRRPYILLYNNVRAIANEAVLLVVLGIYGYYRAFVDHTMHIDDTVSLLPWVEIGLLLACIIANIALMIKFRLDTNKLEAGKEMVDEKVKIDKLEENENHQFMEETKLRLKALASDRSASTTRFNLRNSLSGDAFGVDNLNPPEENENVNLSAYETVLMKTRLEDKLLNKNTPARTALTQDNVILEQ